MGVQFRTLQVILRDTAKTVKMTITINGYNITIVLEDSLGSVDERDF